ncbi:hypothetical protein C0585_05695 [Candidatus Woesearchaeota archaeon]|nr:MAG: hypothetical protein C0585_05695 [Candidatus Woesearchaeota archaeon]
MAQQETNIGTVTRDEFNRRLHENFGEEAKNGTNLEKAFSDIQNYLFSNKTIEYSNPLFDKLVNSQYIKKVKTQTPILLQSVIGYENQDFFEQGKFLFWMKNEEDLIPIYEAIKDKTARYDGKSIVTNNKKHHLLFDNGHATLTIDEGDFIRTINYSLNDYIEENRFDQKIIEEQNKTSIPKFINAIAIYFGRH